ncbi:MAG: BUG/TctC family periplasmic protein, partial [uncultured Acetobacteraceae bacterium]
GSQPPRRARAAARPRGARLGPRAGALPEPAHHRPGALPARRRDGRADALHGGSGDAGLRADRAGGEQARRGQHARRGHRRAGAAGRLPADADDPALPAAALDAVHVLRPAHGLHAHPAPHRLPVRRGGARGRAVPDVAGPGRRRAQAAGARADRQHRRQRHAAPDHGGPGGARNAGRHPRPVPRRGRRRAATAGRAHRGARRRFRRRPARERGQAAVPEPVGARAVGALAGRAHAGRTRLPGDGRHLALRAVRAAGHGPGGGEDPARRAEAGAVRPAAPGHAQAAGPAGGVPGQRRLRAFHAGRDRDGEAPGGTAGIAHGL